MGTELGNLCSLLCIFILHVSILTHVSPSPPLLTFGARHSHGCGRLYACSPPGGTQCPPFAVHVTVINTTTTTVHKYEILNSLLTSTLQLHLYHPRRHLLNPLHEILLPPPLLSDYMCFGNVYATLLTSPEKCPIDLFPVTRVL
jgi:hypothetical protein